MWPTFRAVQPPSDIKLECEKTMNRNEKPFCETWSRDTFVRRTRTRSLSCLERLVTSRYESRKAPTAALEGLGVDGVK